LSGNLDAAVPITGGSLPNQRLRIGHLYLDNPNPVAVRVNLLASASALFSRGRKAWVYAYGSSVPFTPGCKPTQLPDGSCYGPPTNGVEEVLTDQSLSSIPTVFQVFLTGTEIGPCSGCAATERELPPGSTVEVWIETSPYLFVWPPYPLGRLTNPNLPATAIGSAAEEWVKWFPNGAGQVFPQTWWYLTRLAVTPSVVTTLQSRPADSRATLGPASGTNTSSFAPTPSVWITAAPGEASF
jgi:hypothetical protein